MTPKTLLLLAAVAGMGGLGSFVRADHGAPAPRLGGVTLCVAPSSVQLTLEPPSPVETRVREAVLETLQETLTARGVPFETDCGRARGYVLLTLYARFLDPETYVGFPADAYTYVSSAQVGAFIAAAGPDTALPEGRYRASASDIVRAPTAAAPETQSRALAQTWRGANTPPRRSLLLFAGLGAVLAALRALPPVLGQRLRS